MSSQYEANSSAVSGSSSAYAKLSNYNRGTKVLNLPIPPLRAGQVANAYVIPSFDLPGYNALVHSPNGQGGYAQIGPAYKSDDGSCKTTYKNMQCGTI